MSVAKAVIESPRMKQSLPTIDAMFYLAVSIMAIAVCVGFVVR